MVGLAPDFPVGRTQIQDFYPPQLRAFVTNVLLKTMVDQGQWSGETQFQNFQTHDEIPVSDTHFLIRDASGKRVLGLGTVTRDISDARRIAAEREELLAQLEELAAWYRDLVAVAVGAEQAAIHLDKLELLRADASRERILGAERAAEAVRQLWRELEELNLAPQIALEALFVRITRELAA